MKPLNVREQQTIKACATVMIDALGMDVDPGDLMPYLIVAVGAYKREDQEGYLASVELVRAKLPRREDE